jgi:hypothetical protein
MDKTSTLDNMSISINNTDLARFAAEDYPYDPGDQLVNRLLRYSRSLEVKNSKLIDCIENVLN